MVGVHAAFTCGNETLDHAAGLANDLGVGVHIHVAEGRDDAGAGARLENLATDDWLLVHCVHLDRPLRGTVAHNPRSNMNNSVGYARPSRKPNTVVLGTDGIGADMPEEARLAYVRMREDDITAVPDTAWQWLTNGEEFFPEVRNDTVEWSYDHSDSPWHAAFTPGARAVNVSMDGQPVVRDGSPVRFDITEIRTKAAEAAGFDRVLVMDHFYQLPGLGTPDEPMMECYALLSALAQHTKAVRLSSLVTGNTYRNPTLLAKTVTALDIVSGGRATLGIGAGWFALEHESLGYEFGTFTDRFEKLEEALRASRAREEQAASAAQESRVLLETAQSSLAGSGRDLQDARRALEAAGFTDIRARYWNSLLFPLMVAQRANALMQAQDGGGVIEFIGSISAQRGQPGTAAYGAAKAGLIGLSRHVALEGARSGVRSNVVAPGLIDTPLGRAATRGRPSRASSPSRGWTCCSSRGSTPGSRSCTCPPTPGSR